jgi:ABC-type transporter Mla MlaB component
VAVILFCPVEPAELHRQVVALAQPGVALHLDVSAVRRPTLATVDTLARAALLAARQGARLTLVAVPRELAELLAFVGLTPQLGVRPPVPPTG